eukprot:COSAG01_NODE_8578_length_2732_cov_3.123054_3_plen_156_part_00
MSTRLEALAGAGSPPPPPSPAATAEALEDDPEDGVAATGAVEEGVPPAPSASSGVAAAAGGGGGGSFLGSEAALPSLEETAVALAAEAAEASQGVWQQKVMAQERTIAAQLEALREHEARAAQVGQTAHSHPLQRHRLDTSMMRRARFLPATAPQ